MPEFGVIDTEGAFVGEEDFKAADALFDDLAQLSGRFRIEPCHSHVEGVVAAGLPFGLGLPGGEAVGGRHVARGADHFENGGGASDQRSLCAGLVVVLRNGTHKGQVNVGVRVDESGENVFAGRIDNLGAGGRGDVPVDPRDSIAFAKNVGGVTRVGVDDVGVFKEK